MKKFLNNIDIPFFDLGLVYFIATFFTDSRIINFNKASMSCYFIVKVIVFILIFLAFQFLARLFYKKNTNARKYFKYFLIYFIPTFLMLLLIWPGIWYGSDVITFVKVATKVKLHTRLIYLTSIFYSVGLSLFPVLSGAIILQLIYMAIVVSYIVKNTFDYFKNSKWCYLVYLPFFLPVTIFYTLYANRPIMYGITYLLLVAICLFDYLNKKKLSKLKFLILALLIAIVSNWRSEAIYLVLAGPLFIFLIYKIKPNLKSIIGIFIPIIGAFIIVKAPQVYLENKQEKVVNASRNLPIYINSLSYMMQKDLRGDNLQDNYDKISKVLNLDSLKKYWSIDDTPCAWRTTDNCVLNDYTFEEYQEFKEAANEIIVNNFDLYLEAKYLTFQNATRLYSDKFSAINLYISDKGMLLNDTSTKVLTSNETRRKFVRLLEGRVDSLYNSYWFYRYINNLVIPLVVLAIMFIVSIFKKKLITFLLSGMLIGHTLLVFLTAPASYFMYYYNIFLIGMFIGIFSLISMIYNLRNKKIKN